jgi:translation elongation factor EF-Tu-like GTPase
VDGRAEFVINDTFSVPYTGAVAAGVVNSGIIRVGDTMWMVIMLIKDLTDRAQIIQTILLPLQFEAFSERESMSLLSRLVRVQVLR